MKGTSSLFNVARVVSFGGGKQGVARGERTTRTWTLGGQLESYLGSMAHSTLSKLALKYQLISRKEEECVSGAPPPGKLFGSHHLSIRETPFWL